MRTEQRNFFLGRNLVFGDQEQIRANKTHNLKSTGEIPVTKSECFGTYFQYQFACIKVNCESEFLGGILYQNLEKAGVLTCSCGAKYRIDGFGHIYLIPATLNPSNYQL